jgi:hypothetical protein
MLLFHVTLAKVPSHDAATEGMRLHGATLRLGCPGRGLEVVEIPVLDLPASSLLLRASLYERQGRIALVPERANDPGALVILSPEVPWSLCARSPGVRELARGSMAQPGLGCRMGKRRLPVLFLSLPEGSFLEGKSWGATSVHLHRLSFDGGALLIKEQFTPQDTGEGGEP